MNDLFGLAPNAYSSAREIRLLMGSFGPQSSRFILTFPLFSEWRDRLLSEFENAGDIEKERIKSVLKSAKDNHALIDRGNLTFNNSLSWTENAIQVWKDGGDFKKIYVSDDEHHAISQSANSCFLPVLLPASEPEPFTASDEQIDTTPQSYWRSSKILCSISQEIHFIDPYLNPLKRDFKGIFSLFLQELSKKRKVTTVHFWVRGKLILDSHGESAEPEIRDLITSSISGASHKLSVNFNLVSDDTATDKLHARYLLSECGGIKFDQGFQKLPDGRTNIVSPSGVDLHKNLFQKFSHQKFDLKIASSILVTSR